MNLIKFAKKYRWLIICILVLVIGLLVLWYYWSSEVIMMQTCPASERFTGYGIECNLDKNNIQLRLANLGKSINISQKSWEFFVEDEEGEIIKRVNISKGRLRNAQDNIWNKREILEIEFSRVEPSIQLYHPTFYKIGLKKVGLFGHTSYLATCRINPER